VISVANVLIRGVSEKTLERLKSLAKQHNRSLQQELKEMLENLTTYYPSDISKRASAIRNTLRKKRISFSDSTEVLREDRCR
jgi:plasmid stability protein